MSYKDERSRLVRREGQLMNHFIDATDKGDTKKRNDVLKHIGQNQGALRSLGPAK